MWEGEEENEHCSEIVEAALDTLLHGSSSLHRVCGYRCRGHTVPGGVIGPLYITANHAINFYSIWNRIITRQNHLPTKVRALRLLRKIMGSFVWSHDRSRAMSWTWGGYTILPVQGSVWKSRNLHDPQAAACSKNWVDSSHQRRASRRLASRTWALDSLSLWATRSLCLGHEPLLRASSVLTLLDRTIDEWVGAAILSVSNCKSNKP